MCCKSIIYPFIFKAGSKKGSNFKRNDVTFPITFNLDNGVKAEVNEVAGYPGRYIFHLTKPDQNDRYSFAYALGPSLSDNQLHQEGQIGPDGQNAIRTFLTML